MKSKQTNYNAGIYLRLSKDDERAGESLSIENQKLMLSRYVHEQGFNLIDEYVDDGCTGTTFDRPQVQRLLEDAKNGRINLIVVKDLSRFGRNYIQVGQYIDYIFPMYNIRFIALTDNIDTANANSAAMDMMPIMNVFNEWHAANTSKKIRAVIAANAKAGKYRVTYAPYGYVKGTCSRKLPIVDEPAATNVKRIFEMRSRGMSPNKIAQTLNEEGVPNPTDYRCQRFNLTTKKKTLHLWQTDVVKQILHNPTYLGHLVQLRTTSVSYKNKKQIVKDDSERVTIYGTHEAIVGQELWDKCREVEASVSQGKKNKRGITQPLSGLMYCADCGGKMRLGWNNTRRRRIDPRTYHRENYNCGNYSRFGKLYCFSHYIKLKTINAVVLMDIRSKTKLVMENEKRAREEFLKRKDKLSAAEQAIDRNKLKKGLNRLSDLDRMISSVYEDKVLGKIPEETCISLLNRYLDEKSALKPDVDVLERKLSEVKKDETDVDEFIRRIKGYVDVQELTREMCLELIEYITVDAFPHDDKRKTREIHIYYKLIDKKKTPEPKEQTA
ncbi:MAG: recombinase family protein [Firmicutes bacterium]|nr:recombinase family protein [Bacillota bacterium]